MQGNTKDLNERKRIFHVSSRLNIMGLNPEAMVRGVQQALGKNEADDQNRAL